VRVTSHSYWEHGAEVQSTLGRVRSQLSWENRGNLYGGDIGSFSFIFGMNNKQREGKKSIGARARRMGELWSMLEHVFGAFWS
jgi:hypothetical protein